MVFKTNIHNSSHTVINMFSICLTNYLDPNLYAYFLVNKLICIK